MSQVGTDGIAKTLPAVLCEVHEVWSVAFLVVAYIKDLDFKIHCSYVVSKFYVKIQLV